MTTQYSKITPEEYNSIRALVVGRLGTSVTGTLFAVMGYGHPVVSSPVSQHEKVTELQLDKLREDIVTAYTHQNGAAPTITNVTIGDKTLASVFTQYTSLAIGILQNESGTGSPVTYTTTVAANQLAPPVTYTQTETYASYLGTPGTGGGWKNYAFYELEITFASANDARYFFNTGSAFNFAASRTGGTTSPAIGLDQNASWTTLLQTVTSENPTFDKTKFYALTDSYAVFYNKNSTGTYAANRYTLSAKCNNVALNYQGGATVVTIKIEFVDAFNDGNTTNYDGVDGTFTSTVTRKMPKGPGAGGAVYVAPPSAVVPTPTNGLTENGTPIYITAAYEIICLPTEVTESSSFVALSFTATNYNVPNTVTWTITATTTTGLSDFVETGWTPGTNLEGFKTLTRTTTTTGTYAISLTSTSITTNPDRRTEGTETFTISARGSADGSGGGFTVNTPVPLTVTDSSKTDTPGITITGGSTITTIPTGASSTGTWTINSQALTGGADLIIYGFYLDISTALGIDSYAILPPNNANFPNLLITQAAGQYRLPTPYTLTNGSSFNLGVTVTSNSGPFPSSTTAKLKIISNAGSVDGSGATTGPSYTTTSKDILISILTPTLVLSWSADPSSVSYKYQQNSTGSGSTTVRLANNGTGRAEVSGYSVSSPGGTVTPGTFPVPFLLPGDSWPVTVTYSSNFAYNGNSTVSITASNSLIGTSNITRNVAVTATAALPSLSLSLSTTSIATEVGKASSAVTITFNNTGDAPATISLVQAQGNQFITAADSTGPSITSVPAGGSASTTYTFTRSRIGSSLVTISVTSNDPTGIKTAIIAVSGITRIPTFRLLNDGVVTGSGWTDGSNPFSIVATSAGTLKKDTRVRVEIANMEPNANYMFELWWTQSQDQYGGGGIGCHANQPTITSPVGRPLSGLSDATGFATPWSGTTSSPGDGFGSFETRFWRAGRNRFYGQIPVGKYDDGTQAWYTNSTSSTSAAGSGRWAFSASSPESACSAIQVWVGFTVVPNITWNLDTPYKVQGNNAQIDIKGAASGCTIAVAATVFTVDTGSTTGVYSITDTLFTSDGNGMINVVFPANRAIGTYAGLRPISPDGWGGGIFYLGSLTTYDIWSPPLYQVIEIDPGLGVGSQAVSLHPNVNGPIGTFNIFRRFSTGGNGTYAARVLCLADDQVTVYCQGIMIVASEGWTYAAVREVNIVVTDSYTHWRFDFVNITGLSYFAVACYVGAGYANLYFATESGVCLTASPW